VANIEIVVSLLLLPYSVVDRCQNFRRDDGLTSRRP